MNMRHFADCTLIFLQTPQCILVLVLFGLGSPRNGLRGKPTWGVPNPKPLIGLLWGFVEFSRRPGRLKHPPMTDCVIPLHLCQPVSGERRAGRRVQRGRLWRNTSPRVEADLSDCWNSITPGRRRWNQLRWQASLLAAPSKSGRINYLSKRLCSSLDWLSG